MYIVLGWNLFFFCLPPFLRNSNHHSQVTVILDCYVTWPETWTRSQQQTVVVTKSKGVTQDYTLNYSCMSSLLQHQHAPPCPGGFAINNVANCTFRPNVEEVKMTERVEVRRITFPWGSPDQRTTQQAGGRGGEHLKLESEDRYMFRCLPLQNSWLILLWQCDSHLHTVLYWAT